MDDAFSNISLFIIGMFFVFIMTISDANQYSQDDMNLVLQETIRSSAISNVDKGSRVSPGELFIEKKDFEEDFVNLLKENKTIKITDDTSLKFDYLDNDNGATKAIRVYINEKNKEYSSTVVVSNTLNR